MKVICAWCIREGAGGFLREKAPFDDSSETHGLCDAHFHVLRWRQAASDAPKWFPLRALNGWLLPLFTWVQSRPGGKRPQKR